MMTGGGQLACTKRRIKNANSPTLVFMGKTVLIVDDNAFVRRALRKLLTRELGVNICEAQNGKEAIAKARELQPDLIVLDALKLGFLTGEEFDQLMKPEKMTRP